MTEEKDIQPAAETRGLNFVEQIVADDLREGKNGGRLNTRFPPEPNGYSPYRPRQGNMHGLRSRRAFRRHL